MKTINVPLDEEDFRRLVAGGVIEKRMPDIVVRIALSDIGYPIMVDSVMDAWGKFEERR